MGVLYWEGDVDGDWMTVGNWSTGAKPVDGDEVIFDARCNAASGYSAPDEGMLVSESGAAANDKPDLVHFKKGYDQGVASLGEPLCFAPTRIIIEGTGTYYIMNGSTDNNTDSTITETIINNKEAVVYLLSNVNTGPQKSVWTKVHLTAGELHLAYWASWTCGTDVSTLVVAPNRNSEATVYIEKDAYHKQTGVMNDIIMAGGTLYTDSGVATLRLHGGTFNMGTDLAGAPEGAVDIKTDLFMYGGTFNWYPDDSGNPYIEQAHIYGGNFNANGSLNNDRAKVLGNGAGDDIYLYKGATMNLDNGMGNITLKAGSQFWNLGGTLNVDSNSSMTWAYDEP